MKSLALFGALIASAATSVAHAQLYYSDEYGRAVEFTSPDIPSLTLSSQEHTPNDIAALFRAACLDSKLDATAIQTAVSAQPWDMLRRDVKIPFSGPTFDPLLPRWLGQGISLIATPVTIGIVKGGGFRITGPQCTLASGEASFSQQELETALTQVITQVINSAPLNADEAMKKGKPNKNYSPRWKWTGVSGEEQEIGITMMSSSRNYSGRLQISLIPPKPAKKN